MPVQGKILLHTDTRVALTRILPCHQTLYSTVPSPVIPPLISPVIPPVIFFSIFWKIKIFYVTSLRCPNNIPEILNIEHMRWPSIGEHFKRLKAEVLIKVNLKRLVFFSVGKARISRFRQEPKISEKLTTQKRCTIYFFQKVHRYPSITAAYIVS